MGDSASNLAVAGAVDMWESRAWCGISKRGGKLGGLSFPPRVISTALTWGLGSSSSLGWARPVLRARVVQGNSGGSTGSSPVISTPSRGHEYLPEVCRIHSAIPPRGIMTTPRLHLPGPTRESRILIKALLAEQVEGTFGQVPRHRPDGLGVPLTLAHAPVQLADVPHRK